jgi:hypothetical protein
MKWNMLRVNMKVREVFRPANSRYTVEEIVDPIYMSIDQYRQAAYIPDNIRSRIIIVEFVEEEDERSKQIT